MLNFQIFSQADAVIILVITTLGLFSLGAWTVILYRLWQWWQYKKYVDIFNQYFQDFWTVESLYKNIQKMPKDHSIYILFQSSFLYLKKEFSDRCSDQQLDRYMKTVCQKILLDNEKGMGVLSCVSSTAPFIGLLGTVWGIMNSFASIASMKSAQISVVAPGLSEALYTTALGLGVAIPANLALHVFVRQHDMLEKRMSILSEELQQKLFKKLMNP